MLNKHLVEIAQLLGVKKERIPGFASNENLMGAITDRILTLKEKAAKPKK